MSRNYTGVGLRDQICMPPSTDYIRDIVIPPLKGSTPQELIGDPSHRLSANNRHRDGQPRRPLRDNPKARNPPCDVTGTTAISSTGLEKILARFDRMERRLEKLEVPEHDPHYFSDEIDDEGYHSPRDAWAADDDVHRPFIHGRRDRGGDICHRRGAACALHWRDDRLPQQNVHRAPYRDRPEPRHRTCWDRPQDRYLGMDESEQQHYVDFYSGSRRRRTSWDQPSRTSGCRVGEIRAPPLPKPPPQPVPEPELFYGPTHRGTSDTPASKHTTRPSFGPRGFLHADSDVPSRFPPSAYTGQQREQSQTRNRHLHPTFPSPRTPAHPQHVLDQQPQPSHRRAAPPAPVAAPPPPLHMDQQRSPSCGHPTTRLRQAEACLELSATVKQPLLQRPPSYLRSPSLHSATKLVSCEEKYVGIEGDAKVLNQVDLRLNEKKLVDDEVRAIEVDKIDDDDGLHDSSKRNEEEAYEEEDDSTEEVLKVIASFPPVVQVQSKSIVENCWGKKGDSAYTGWCIIIGVCVDLSISDVTKRRSAVRWAFDPGGDTSPKLLRSTLALASWFPP
ncbi:uncharacterized protein LOC121801021 [Salvia splendens]|uniref:uncharacterized protein LOC121801021 n=1 Tax=Salvia splendens TaxID=180675 RepID=UPI001C254E63|nr:uncharacterized protein LOC121801021 [Salvia splendens]